MGDKFTIKQFMSRLENGQIAYDKAMVNRQYSLTPWNTTVWLNNQNRRESGDVLTPLF